MDKDQYYKLWQILNGKVKSFMSQGRKKRNSADRFTKDDLLQILNHLAMSGNDPARLRGREHFNLQLQNFIRRKDKYGGFDVIIYKSKTNQHGANNIEFQVKFNGQWYHKQHVSEKEIKSFMKKIVTLTKINVNDRKISNHSGLARYKRPETEIQQNNSFNFVEAFEESMEQSTLSTDNFIIVQFINSANSNIEITRKPLKDLNKIQENKSQNLEELVSKLTAYNY
ncbi:hypothetical protein RhiirA4_466497 [Rhizophagus irregularis]|uniref:Uncharacterized protein n=1 Tax=Rhizophagus irregularis TaxID=588596 RepID=A0A2I1GU35_9GLOM|nr:hypothetical protein RhiirA4_466497 [Rhizophagus irregularis]